MSTKAGGLLSPKHADKLLVVEVELKAAISSRRRAERVMANMKATKPFVLRG